MKVKQKRNEFVQKISTQRGACENVGLVNIYTGKACSNLTRASNVCSSNIRSRYSSNLLLYLLRILLEQTLLCTVIPKLVISQLSVWDP